MLRDEDKHNKHQAKFLNRYSYTEIKVGTKTGETLIAYDEVEHKQVVVKRPGLRAPIEFAESLADLKQEKRALKNIGKHSSVCELLESGESFEGGSKDPYLYLVIEHASGQAVTEIIEQYALNGKALPEGIWLDIIVQLLDVLSFAHQLGMLYNDVKADHLFWDKQKRKLKMIDWGNVKFNSDGISIDYSEDVFQCGQLMYYFIVREEYIKTQEETEFERRIERINNHANAQVAFIVGKALHPQHNERYQTAGELLLDLLKYKLQRDYDVKEDLKLIFQEIENSNTLEEFSKITDKLVEVENYDDTFLGIGEARNSLEVQKHRIDEQLKYKIAHEEANKRLSYALTLMEEGDWEHAANELLNQKETLLEESVLNIRLWKEFLDVVLLSFLESGQESRKKEFKRMAQEIVISWKKEDSDKRKLIISIVDKSRDAIDKEARENYKLNWPYDEMIEVLSELAGLDLLQASMVKLHSELFFLESENTLKLKSKVKKRSILSEYNTKTLSFIEKLEDNADRPAKRELSEHIHWYEDLSKDIGAHLVDMQKLNSRLTFGPIETNRLIRIETITEKIQAILHKTLGALKVAEVETDESQRQLEIKKVELFDPHNYYLKEIKFDNLEVPIPRRVDYINELKKDANGEEFDKWLSETLSNLYKLSENEPDNTIIKDEYKLFLDFSEIWKQAKQAFDNGNVSELENSIDKLYKETNSHDERVKNVVKKFWDLVWGDLGAPWRLMGETNFTKKLDAIADEIINYPKENNLLNSLQKEILDYPSKTLAEQLWTNHFINLSCAVIETLDLRIETAVEYLGKAKEIKINERGIGVVSELIELAKKVKQNENLLTLRGFISESKTIGALSATSYFLKYAEEREQTKERLRDAINIFSQLPSDSVNLIKVLSGSEKEGGIKNILVIAAHAQGLAKILREGKPIDEFQEKINVLINNSKPIQDVQGKEIAQHLETALLDYEDKLQTINEKLIEIKGYIKKTTAHKVTNLEIVIQKLEEIESLIDKHLPVSDIHNRISEWKSVLEKIETSDPKLNMTEIKRIQKEGNITEKDLVFPIIEFFINQAIETEKKKKGESYYRPRKAAESFFWSFLILCLLLMLGYIFTPFIFNIFSSNPSVEVSATEDNENSTLSESTLENTEPNLSVKTCQKIQIYYSKQEWESILTEISRFRDSFGSKWGEELCELDENPLTTTDNTYGLISKQTLIQLFVNARKSYQLENDSESERLLNIVIVFDTRFSGLEKLPKACRERSAGNREKFDEIVKTLNGNLVDIGLTPGDLSAFCVEPFSLLLELNNIYPDVLDKLTSSDGQRYFYRTGTINTKTDIYYYRFSALGGKEAFLPFSQIKNVFPEDMRWKNIIEANVDLYPLSDEDTQPFEFLTQGSEIGLVIEGTDNITFTLVVEEATTDTVVVVPLGVSIGRVDKCEVLGNSRYVFYKDNKYNTLQIGFNWDAQTKSIQLTVNGNNICTTPIYFSDAPLDVTLYANSVDGDVDLLIEDINIWITKE